MTRTHTLLLLAGLLVAGAALLRPAPARTDPRDDARLLRAFQTEAARMAERARPAVVGIQSQHWVALDPEGTQFHKRKALGSGVIVDRGGHILTSHHVVADASELLVQLAGKTLLRARLVGTDPKTDLALIKLDNPPADLTPALLGTAASLRVGHLVFAIGNPSGLSRSISIGIVSGLERTVDETGYEHYIQTDASINPGNSGGPIVNINGEVVGVITIIATEGGGSEGLGFAVPIEEGSKLIRLLKSR